MTPLRGRPPGQPPGAVVVRPDNALIADVRRVALTPGRRLRTRVAGIFLFLPLLAQAVVYLYRAGNSVARKSGTIPPYHDHVRGTLPWYRTSFSTS